MRLSMENMEYTRKLLTNEDEEEVEHGVHAYSPPLNYLLIPYIPINHI